VNPNYLLLLLFAGVVGLTFLIFLGFSTLVGAVRRRSAAAGDQGPSLAERALANRPPENWEGRLDRSFERVVRWSLLNVTPSQALGFIILAGISLACVAYFLSEEWWMGGVGLLVGMGLATAVFLFLQRRWRRAVQDQLPEGIFLLARSLRAGQSIEQALASSRTFCPRPLGEVFGRIADQVEMGLTPAEATQRMADATALVDLQTLASVLALHRDVGGNLPELLDRLAVSVRDRNQFRGFARAATALSRASATFVAIGAPAFALILCLDQPDLFRNFFASWLGIFLFTLGVLLNLIGIIWLTLLVRGVEY
jgi:tight adherence protein B